MWAAGILVAGVVGLIAFRANDYVTRRSRMSNVELKSAPETMAVLPFRDISAGTDESWGVGITDAIISRLTSLQNGPFIKFVFANTILTEWVKKFNDFMIIIITFVSRPICRTRRCIYKRDFIS